MRGSYLSTVYCFVWLGKLRDARCFANFANTVIPGRLQPLLPLRELYAIWKQTSLVAFAYAESRVGTQAQYRNFFSI